MIGFLKGKIISAKPTQVLLDVNGVGYLINISINTFERITDKEAVSLFVYTSVKEDSITLYGFFIESEKQMFELLISVNGVGPKLALNILSGIRADELKDAIQSGDSSRITAIPGIGKKTADRLVLELRTKVDHIVGESGVKIPFSVKNEAVSALTTLGYNQKLSENTVRDVLGKDPGLSLEEIIKRALSKLNN